MVIGGQAVLIYGEPRLTKDIDITLGISPDNLDDILALVSRLKLIILTDSPRDFVQKTLVLPVRDELTGIRIDLVFSYSFYERQAIERSKSVTFQESSLVKVQFAALEDIVIHKIIAGRARDIEDVRSILLKNPGYDRKYITRWLNDFDESLGEGYLNSFSMIEKELER
jgi:hypothetical protein